MADEKIIQISQGDDFYLTVLTNHGRLFSTNGDGWTEYELPPLNKTKPRAQAKSEGYSEDFERLWRKYPKGHSGSKAKTYRLYSARLREAPLKSHLNNEYLLMDEGLDRYIPYLEATGISPKSSETFFGKDRHYTNEFVITNRAARQNREKQEWEKIPENEHLIFDWAKKHGFKVNGQDSIFDTKRKIQAQIKQRIEQELN